jgi:metal-responsive CopG/Arc/MetJ family transcriptional regulator
MEVIVLKGAVGEIERMADTLISLKGVKLGKINLISSATP